MKTITIKPRDNPDLEIDATVNVMTGRPVVAVHQSPLQEDVTLSPIEARRVAKALLKAADVAQAKHEWGVAEKRRV